MRVDLRRPEELRRAYGHLKTTTDLEREYLQEMVDLFQTRVATELNRFVRKITAWGTIGIAWTVIAGIYGMNFTHMPKLDWRFGYAPAQRHGTIPSWIQLAAADSARSHPSFGIRFEGIGNQNSSRA